MLPHYASQNISQVRAGMYGETCCRNGVQKWETATTEAFFASDIFASSAESRLILSVTLQPQKGTFSIRPNANLDSSWAPKPRCAETFVSHSCFQTNCTARGHKALLFRHQCLRSSCLTQGNPPQYNLNAMGQRHWQVERKIKYPGKVL